VHSGLIQNVRQPSLLVWVGGMCIQHRQCALNRVWMNLESTSFSCSFQFLRELMDRMSVKGVNQKEPEK
jgi:hypothetical protein